MCFPALHCATWLIHRAGPLVTHRFSLSLSLPNIVRLMETRAEKDRGWAVSMGMTGAKGKASPGKPCLSGWVWREEAIGSIWVKLVYPWEESLALMHWTTVVEPGKPSLSWWCTLPTSLPKRPSHEDHVKYIEDWLECETWRMISWVVTWIYYSLARLPRTDDSTFLWLNGTILVTSWVLLARKWDVVLHKLFWP